MMGGGFRGGFQGGFQGGPAGGFGNHMGGMMGGGGRGGRNFTQDLYADYNGPDASGGVGAVGGDGYGADGMAMGGGVVGAPAAVVSAEPSTQIMVRNVSIPVLFSLVLFGLSLE